MEGELGGGGDGRRARELRYAQKKHSRCHLIKRNGTGRSVHV